MKIRTKLFASHATMSGLAVVVALAIIAILRVSDANVRELQSSYEQIRAINLIDSRANRYSEQVAELFILGTDPAEIEEAHAGLFAALAHKELLVRMEQDELSDAAELDRGREEIGRLEAMRDAVANLELGWQEAGRLLEAGRRAEAERLYRERIEDGFDSALGQLIETATLGEREDVERAIAASAVLSDRLRMLALAMVAATALLVLANAVIVHRTISRPIAALAAGADAVGRGDLDHVLHLRRRDELGHLATRFNEMTAQIRAQRERLMGAKRNLEAQVAERTSELRERSDELEAAVSRLRRLDSDRAQFFADISHELRTPLTIIRGTAEVALRSQDGGADRLREALAQVVRKTDQMGRLAEDLLFLSRSEAGAIQVERVPIDLQDVFADVVLDSHGLTGRAGITLSPRQTSEPVVVEGDADRLRQAILIPLDNAIRLAPAGSTVRLELARHDGRAKVTVSDEGPGFTPDELENAFRRYFRGEGGGGRSGRSTGLGLAIAQWIVGEHDGSITIDSAPEKGATVRIDLPLAETRTETAA
ncbi:sensor histidine kinase [Histidinibacterium lentulum]|uniref:histidine kinase n=1 Tax=Histidinibacterium lentulum TaxID=2480588 RepID=A0A3N2QY72_9RHOB|nr:ATP-binding protein [Histidinibacterium lentulum]ROU00159.1 sensor histidine kinase [Histidinibacterium lentulum]